MTKAVTDGTGLLKDIYIHLPCYKNSNFIQIWGDPYILGSEVYMLNQYIFPLSLLEFHVIKS